MSFTALASYESPSRLGPPLVFTTKSEVLLQRPDRLRVITLGDGPASEFYYDGKMMIAFAPAENLVAVTNAPPTIEAALKKAFDVAAIYFPFTDIVVADPWAALADGLKLAFYIGRSNVVGGVATDMVALANDEVFLQLWIGVDDKLPRRIRAQYKGDTLRLRHEVEFTDWKIDAAIAPDAFVSAKAAAAPRMAFANPNPTVPPGVKPLIKSEVRGAEDAKIEMTRPTMRFNLLILAGALAAAVAAPLALAYSHANRYGGSTEHSYGQTSHTNAYGGSTSHAYGEGHRAHEHVRRQHRARMGRRHRAHQRLRRQHVRRRWCGRRAHDAVWRDRLPAALPRRRRVLPVSPAGRRPLLRIDRLLRLRGGSRRGRRHGGGRRGRIREYRCGDVQRLFVRLRGGHGEPQPPRPARTAPGWPRGRPQRRCTRWA